MSQAGFGDSSSQESISPLMPEPQSQSQIVSANIGDSNTLINTLPRQVLEQELQFCNERSQQAQVLLRQAQEQLQLSQLVIQRQETLTQTLQSRIDQLERELQDVHNNCDELRDRLKRQQHHTSQLKAALERCLDTSTPAPKDMALSALESWSIAKLADEKITPVEAIGDASLQNVVKIKPAPQPIEMPEVLAEPETATKSDPQPEAIAEPLSLNIPTKNQPISPLIVRPHKANQGSPIALNLPKLQTANADDDYTQEKFPRKNSLTQAEPPISEKNEYDALIASATTHTNSSVVPSVAAPKFMQSLYAGSSSATEPQVEDSQSLAIANASGRKPVTSLAAVQLPQFPPLPRR